VVTNSTEVQTKGKFNKMKSDSDIKLRESIDQQATAYAEANVYSLDNNYLSQDQKLEVELWYQLPGNVMFLSFILVAIWSVLIGPLSWSMIIGIPFAVNVTVGLLNWQFYNKSFLFKLYRTALHSWTLYLVGFSAAAFLFYKGAIVLAIISLVAPLGLLAFVEPHLFFYPMLTKQYRMHPKYAFFKKFYEVEFPFEEAIVKPIIEE